MIWIDQGSVILDDIPENVVRGYEDSIRLQEESRLRKKVLINLQSNRKGRISIYLELRASNERPLFSPIFISRLALTLAGNCLATIDWSKLTENDASNVVIEGSCWGHEDVVDGIRGRWMLNYGLFNKVAAHFSVDPNFISNSDELKEIKLEVEAFSELDNSLLGAIELDEHELLLGKLEFIAGKHQRIIVSVDSQSSYNGFDRIKLNTSGYQGTGAVLIDGANIYSQDGKETFSIRHGDFVSLTLDYRIIDSNLFEYSDICLVIFRSGTRENICRILTRDLLLDGKNPRGKLRLDIPKVILGSGRYSIWVFIAKHGYMDADQGIFYSLNPGVHLSQPDVIEFEVTGGVLTVNTAFVASGIWSQHSL